MTRLRSRFAATALVGGVLAIGGLAVVPALAYPPGTALAIACDAFTYSPGATATCTLTNINPAGPNDIVLGEQIGAAGEGVSIARASFLAQEAAPTYVEQLILPMTLGTYEVIGTSAGEVATTTVRVVASGEATAFSITVSADGTSVTVQNGQPGCSVTIYANGTAVGTGVVGADGSVTIVPTSPIPAGAEVTAQQSASDSCAALSAAPVTVSGPAKPATKPPAETAKTPATGANVALGVVAGIGALAVGGGLVASSRRKKV